MLLDLTHFLIAHNIYLFIYCSPQIQSSSVIKKNNVELFVLEIVSGSLVLKM